MDKLQTFTSTGSKLINHPVTLSSIKYNKKAFPISLQVAPTSQCNLNCCFCSNVNREKHQHLGIDELTSFICSLRGNGLKAVEITGGGDPTMYPHIRKLIHFCFSQGLKIGMISNGVALVEKIGEYTRFLTWLRISMNCLDYVDSIEIPKIQGTLGFSYVMNDNTTREILDKLHEYVKIYSPEYVRIVPNCQVTFEEQETNNKKLSELVSKWGEPFFYQAKTFEKPENCWWGYLKPFLLHDGYIYPCSSVVLNDTADRKFHDKYRWGHMSTFIEDIVNKRMTPFDTSSCSHCVFTEQNKLVDDLMHTTGMEEFI